MRFARIPEELKLLRQWVVWQAVPRDGKVTKVPYNGVTGQRASVTNRSDWCSFDEAVAALEKFPQMSGVGFVFAEGGPYVGIDLDKTSDPRVWEYHSKIFNATRSYTERSPSGNGAHIIVRAKIAGQGRRNTAMALEVYGGARYFTVTGDVIDGRDTIEDGQELVDWLLRDMKGGGGDATVCAENRPAADSDGDLLNRIRASRSGPRFETLFNGAWQQRIGDPPGAGYNSQSDADQAFFNIVAGFTQNHEQIVRIFHASALGKREKAHRPGYLRDTLTKALDRHIPSDERRHLEEVIVKPGIAAAHARATQSIPPMGDPASDIEILPSESITPGDVNWLWRNWMASGMLHIFYGTPGIGKSTVMLSMAANLSVGGFWPDGSRARVGNTLIWSDEDDIRLVLKPRLDQMGIDPDTGAIGPRPGRVRFLSRRKDPSTGKMRRFIPAIDMPILIEHLKIMRDRDGWAPDVLFLDPLIALQMNKRGSDPNNQIAVREAFEVLDEFATSSGCAVVGLHHAAKNSAGADPVDRAIGSTANIAKPRFGYMAVKNRKHEEDSNEPQCVFVLSKHNLGRGAESFGYDIKDGPIPVPENRENGAIYWREAVSGSAREVIKEAESPPDEEVLQGKADVARAWLQHNLPAMGETSSVDLIDAAAKEGISRATLYRVAKEMVIMRRGPDARSYWSWKPEPKGKPRR